MNLKIMLPTKILIDQKVEKIVAEAKNGSFCLLPSHIDFAASLVAGILSFSGDGGRETFVAIDEGVLIKCGDEVYVSVRDAIEGERPETLADQIHEKFTAEEAERQLTETALAKIESNFIDHFLRINKYND